MLLNIIEERSGTLELEKLKCYNSSKLALSPPTLKLELNIL